MSQTPDIFPGELLEHLAREPSNRQWWAIYTMSRQEKSLARDLFTRKIPYYLPLIRSTNVYRGRRVSSYKPLFTSYVFLFGTELERVESLKTNRISRILEVHDPEALIRDLAQLQRLILSGAPLTVEDRLTTGDRVRIKSGSMAGLEGTVIKRHGETRLLVSVDFLQKGASIAIDDFQVAPLV
ncbi:MAG: transcription termination/antitermination NusG family protein [Pirellulales bacterium]|jgi:transcriptional antiterminator RfaH|nr:transcription termination/antitermination NusG family protein [Thermoguttaceae bacterium]MDD4788376.1 transcription termination/antitermination NusG family protein [Pirellulales bacterium]NLZ03315.1 antitermination protein NusG [Pirellulaceae bacterium]